MVGQRNALLATKALATNIKTVGRCVPMLLSRPNQSAGSDLKHQSERWKKVDRHLKHHTWSVIALLSFYKNEDFMLKSRK